MNIELYEQFDDCRNILKELRLISNSLVDSESFQSMDPSQVDKLQNMLLGLEDLYDLKFEQLEKLIGDATLEIELKEDNKMETLGEIAVSNFDLHYV